MPSERYVGSDRMIEESVRGWRVHEGMAGDGKMYCVQSVIFLP